VQVDAQGRIEYYHGGMIDITERKTAEKALRDSEEKFRRIAERAFDVILTTRLDGVITYVSPSVRRVFGYAPDDMAGKTIMAFALQSDVGELIRASAEIAEGKHIESRRYHLRKKDGSTALVEMNALPVYKESMVVGGQAILRDITETKRLQEQELRAQRLETAGQIAGQVAHDFNNLLAPLVAYPEFIRDGIPSDHPSLGYLDAIESAANKIAEINQQLLTLGRRGHYTQDILYLNTVIPECLRDIGPLPDTLSIKLDLGADLMCIAGGSAQIHRVLTNLLANARDAMNDSGVITIRTENCYIDDAMIAFSRIPIGEYVRVTVCDTGCGIPDHLLPNIFDPFFTTKTTDKERGSGLGLSVVDAVVRDHGGYVDLSTQVGAGTSFFLYFPITRESVDESCVEQASGGTETVLVVDDDEIQRDVSARILGKLGYQVTVVAGGEEAVKFLKKHPQDLLVLDMVMPSGIDGAETYRLALDVNPSQRAIIVSGFSETDRVLQAQALGAGAFVRKPVTAKSIAAAVRNELDAKPRRILLQ
jgi:two-component system cell cycle sensor histidine kinase/response regulator CckA